MRKILKTTITTSPAHVLVCRCTCLLLDNKNEFKTPVNKIYPWFVIVVLLPLAPVILQEMLELCCWRHTSGRERVISKYQFISYMTSNTWLSPEGSLFVFGDWRRRINHHHHHHHHESTLLVGPMLYSCTYNIMH